MNYTAILHELLTQQQNAMVCHLLANGEKVWLRRAAPHNAAWRYALLGGIVSLLGLPVLRPVPNLGGTVKIEAQRLRELAQLGISVPRILAETDSALLLSHEGDITVEAALIAADKEYAWQIWQETWLALLAVHRHNTALSQAFARNMLYRSDGVVFIDFEDNPLDFLPLAHCQCRDYLCFWHSTAWIMEQKGLLPEMQNVLRMWLPTLPATMRADLLKSLRPIMWLRGIHKEFWGSDTLKLAAMARCLRGC